MNIFLTANMKTFDEFAALYSEGDEARANRGRSLFSYALGNSKPEERYKIVDFLLSAHRYSDEDLTPIYDVVFASPDPGFTTVVDGGKPFHELVRAFEDRQVLADRIDDYLRTQGDTH